MTITTFAIVSTVTIIFGLIVYAVIKHFRLSREDYYKDRIRENFFCSPENAIKKFEPLKSIGTEYSRWDRTQKALRSAILNNLRDNGYQRSSREDLPDLLELQNTIRLRPIINELEDLYKRYEEARERTSSKCEHYAHLILRSMSNLKKDKEFKDLISRKAALFNYQVHPNKLLCELIESPEAKEIVERAIDKAVLEAQES